MNPETPISENTSPDASQKRKARKKIIISVIAGIAILLLGIIVIGLMNGNKKDANKNALDNLKPGTITGPYVEREHYPRSSIGSAIADATAMEFAGFRDVIKTSKGIVIYPACTVITQADLRKFNLWPMANPNPGATTMSYIDGTGSGVINFSSSALPSGEGGDECSYALQDKGQVHIDVYQPYLVSNATIDEELARLYEKAPAIKDVSGVELFRKKPSATSSKTDGDKNTIEYLVRKSPELSFAISVEDKNDPQSKLESLIKTALTNLDALAVNPQGAPEPTYKNSPTFKQPYLRACALVDDAGMKAYSGDPAAASLTEKISNSTGVIKFSDLNDPAFYTYVENECHRISASPEGAPLEAKASIDLTTTSYAEVKGAQNSITSDKHYYKDAVGVPGIGDEAVVLTNSASETELTIRKGRFILTLIPDAITQKSKGLDDHQRFINAVKPYVDYMLTKMAQ